MDDEEGKAPETLREFFKRHLEEKVSNPKCEACGNNHWIILSNEDAPNAFSNIPHSAHEGWPVLCTACSNCGNMRIFAAALLMKQFEMSRGNNGG